MVLGALPPFLDTLAGMPRHPQLDASLTRSSPCGRPTLNYPRSLPMSHRWLLSGRDVGPGSPRNPAAFEQIGTPRNAVDALDPPPPTLHLYAQPREPAYLGAQRGFAAVTHGSESSASTHSDFPMFELPTPWPTGSRRRQVLMSDSVVEVRPTRSTAPDRRSATRDQQPDRASRVACEQYDAP